MIGIQVFFTPTLLFSLPGGPEVFIILLVVLLLFGAKKIPELARGLGKGIREFKDASKEIKSEIEREANEIKKIDE
ncbi:MAG: twin-arginine translocase TatA/TatE family subunit [Bacteroidota bacterium]